LDNNYKKPSATGRLLRLSEVLQRLPVSKSTWWEGVRTGKYPQPVKLGERITCWRLEDILQLAERGVSASAEG
jgi:prophage regulatory protein